MEVGLNITNNFKISIGSDIESIIKGLNDSAIGYTMPYKSKDSYVIYIEKYGVELRLKDNIVSFIKTTNTDLNYIITLQNVDPFNALLEIKNKLADKFNIQDQKQLYVDRFEGNTFKSIITVPYDDSNKIKITLILGKNRSIYIETIQLIPI